MTTIYLIRHAEAEGNLYRRAHGWYNSTITDRGYRQIAALSKRFADTKFDAVYSHDRFRTMITALSIYKPHGLPPRRAGRAARRCEIRRGFHGTRLAQPPVGLFLSAGSYAHGVLRRTGDPVESLTRIPLRPQHVASSAPGFSVREVSPVHGNRALRSLVSPVSTEAARNRTASVRWNNP